MSVCCCSLAGTVACDHCRNRSMTFEYSAGTTYSSEDFDFPKKKQTNADRIRNMTDEELASFKERTMYKIYELLAEALHIDDFEKHWDEDGIVKEEIKWLKQEVEA